MFFSALLSSTLFPGGSEVLLVYNVQQAYSPVWCVATATAGNVIGSIITYGMGYYGMQAMQKNSGGSHAPSWLRIPIKRQQQAGAYFQRYGGITLLFAWLPIVGDPLCLVAGMVRFHYPMFVLLVMLGKLGRYTVIVLLVGG